jgi:hypothetical protein
MLAEARATAPDLRWVDGDLADLELGERVDLVVAAGNVMVFLAPGSEEAVVQRLAAHLSPGGLLVSGWRTDRLSVPGVRRVGAGRGARARRRHATWDGDAWVEDAPWCVAVDQRPT